MESETEINKEKIRRFSQILLDTLLIHRISSFDDVPSARKPRQKDRFIFFDNGVRNGILKKHRNHFTPTDLGPLFKAWILQQVLAHGFYHHRNWRIPSYRDDQNVEVDLILDQGKSLLAIEIKFQNKFRTEFAENLNKFEKIAKRKVAKTVVYLGEKPQQTSDGVRVLNYKDFLNELAS